MAAAHYERFQRITTPRKQVNTNEQPDILSVISHNFSSIKQGRRVKISYPYVLYMAVATEFRSWVYSVTENSITIYRAGGEVT